MLDSILEEITIAFYGFVWIVILAFVVAIVEGHKLINDIGCSIVDQRYDRNAPTEFFKIKETRYENNNSVSVSEYFVIFNPPKNRSLLKKTIETYNFQTLSVDTVKKYERWERRFYNETPCLNREYEEGEPYPKLQGEAASWWRLPCREQFRGNNPGQQTDYHDELVISDLWNGKYWYYFYKYKGSTSESFRINDIDTFFVWRGQNAAPHRGTTRKRQRQQRKYNDGFQVKHGVFHQIAGSANALSQINTGRVPSII